MGCGKARVPGQLARGAPHPPADAGTSLSPLTQGEEFHLMVRITFNPEQCGGRPCIRGMRIRVKDVLDLLASGVSEADILADYPYLEAEDMRACLVYAAEESDHPVLVAAGK